MLHPIRDKIVAVPIEGGSAASMGPSKIIVAHGFVDDMRRAEVLAVGDGFVANDGKTVAIAVKPGDVVLHKKDAGEKVYSYGHKYILLRETDVWSVETPEIGALPKGDT